MSVLLPFFRFAFFVAADPDLTINLRASPAIAAFFISFLAIRKLLVVFYMARDSRTE